MRKTNWKAEPLGRGPVTDTDADPHTVWDDPWEIHSSESQAVAAAASVSGPAIEPRDIVCCVIRLKRTMSSNKESTSCQVGDKISPDWSGTLAKDDIKLQTLLSPNTHVPHHVPLMKCWGSNPGHLEC